MQDYSTALIEELTKIYGGNPHWLRMEKLIRDYFRRNRLQPRPLCADCRWHLTIHCPLDGKTRWGTPEESFGCVCCECEPDVENLEGSKE